MRSEREGRGREGRKKEEIDEKATLPSASIGKGEELQIKFFSSFPESCCAESNVASLTVTLLLLN